MELSLIEPGLSNNILPLNKFRIHPCWYAVYTRPHHEKRVYTVLRRGNINTYLPLQSTLKQWSDRKKKVIEPLFSCYLFVHITMKEYYNVLNVPGVIRFVSFEGKAVNLPEKQMQTIKVLEESKFEIEETPIFFQKGNKVKIMFGTLSGVEGELVSYNNKNRVLLRIEEIHKSLIVNVPLQYLELVQ
jgi:transcriptional antiterminator RfaH